MSDPGAYRGHPPRLRCRHCRDVIGVYEPVVIETHGGRHDTSLAAEPSLHGTDEPAFHSVCYDEIYGNGG